MEALALTMQGSLISFDHSQILGTELLFSPLKLLLLVLWIYLCMYSVLRIEYSPLVSKKYKAIANVFGLLIGPFILFDLAVADAAKRVQAGEIGLSEVFKSIITKIFSMNIKFGRRQVSEKEIELLDTSGRSFQEICGKEDEGKDSDNGIMTLTETIILDALRDRASDILMDPKGNNVFTIRFRVDGVLRVAREIDTEQCAAIINGLKAISNMDIAERRRAQDGAFMAKIPAGNVYFRAASAGVLGGEKLSIRVLNQTTGLMALEEIGMSDKIRIKVADGVKQASGMILVCGPTGSGKTTSLYSMLNTVDFYTRNVVTIEDPIEYVLPYASQIEVNVKAEITFATALRSILRQDPDVICVGEIRDSETADMALQASQTGHLVLATLHSSSNLAAIVRLIDLKAKPLMIASAVSMIISQRLVRKLCDNCKQPANIDDAQAKHFKAKGIDASKIMHPKGCPECHNTGYIGRTGIHDVLILDETIKSQLMNNNLSIGDMKQKGDQTARSTLKKEGIKKVLAGVTTFDEVKRVTSNLG
jgi:general secretion pathway protein E